LPTPGSKSNIGRAMDKKITLCTQFYTLNCRHENPGEKKLGRRTPSAGNDRSSSAIGSCAAGT